MMRGPASWSVACRRPDQTISVSQHPLPSAAERQPWLKWPRLRGILVVGESLAIGIRAIMISADAVLEDDQKLSEEQLGWPLATALVAFSAIFIALPVIGTKLLERYVNLSPKN